MYDDHGGPSDVRNEAEVGSVKERCLLHKDSKFVGLSVTIKRSLNACLTKWNPTTTDKHEYSEKCPLILLFPDLQKKYSIIQTIKEQQISPEDITRLLIGKKADFTHLKKSIQRQKNYSYEDHLPTILEEEVFLVNDHKHRGNL